MQQLIYVGQNLPWFVLFIGALVFFHEFGHFVVAKLCGVKVLRFSIGFGPRLFGFVRGETEYWVSLLPLGGYVKMLGEIPGVDIPPEDAPRAFSNRPLWQRSVIALAGPGFNFVLAVIVYFVVALGTHQFLDTRLGTVSAAEPAYQAGLRPGDKITAIDGDAVNDWDELREHIAAQPGASLRITFSRGGAEQTVTVVPQEHEETNLFEEKQTRGRIGISPNFVKPVVGVVDGESPAAKAGVQTGDLVEEVNGERVQAWHEVRDAVLRTPPGQPVRASLRRGDTTLQVQLTPTPPLSNLNSQLFSAADTAGGYTGLVSKESMVSKVEADTPAAGIDLKEGDRLLAFAIEKDGKRVELPIGVWEIDLQAFDGVKADQTLMLTFQHGREVVSKPLVLGSKEQKDEFKNVRKEIVFGAAHDVSLVESYTFERKVGPLEAIGMGFLEVGYATTVIGKGVAKLVTREIPLDSMGGPIMLFVIAEKAAKRGAKDYLRMMALISVNLGLLNLLPVPVLDGGHLLMFGIEAVRRRPPSLRFREVANVVGLALLLLLMVLVFRNDILRFVLG